MPALTQLRLPGEQAFGWYALDRVVDRPLGCSSCHRRIGAGDAHARGEDDGRRLCLDCIGTAERGEQIDASEANRRQRQKKREHADRKVDRAVRMLLDGLAVGSIHELHDLVERGRDAEYLADRGAILSTAVGLARMALPHDPEQAAADLADASRRTHELMYDHALERGIPAEKVEAFYGPRDRSQ